MLCCFGIRARPAQPAPLSREQFVAMASNSVNNVPAAGEGGVDRAMGSQECSLRRRRRSANGGEPREGSGAVVAAGWRGAYGAAGKLGCYRKIMEDKVSLRPSFCTWADGSRMHFFAVFDGHGGPEVSALCRDHMHAILAAELARAAAAYRKEHQQDEEAELHAWEAALRRSFARADDVGASGVPSGTIVGSTAVVALVVRGRILVANCGHSRAVLCRAGRAIPLSQDHKVDRQDEMARVTAAGGVLFHYGGVLRVQGILAMTRALGHTLLKPEVICEPEITITARSEDDDCLILASDGLWDVISSQVACSAARKCLEDKSIDVGTVVGREEEVQCIRAAFHLTDLACRMHGQDDISVVVLDLKVRG